MRNSKHSRLIIWISSFLFLVVGIIGTIFVLVKKDDSQISINSENKYADSYYETLMNDSFDLDGTYSGFLNFEFDSTDHTATLIGFNPVSGTDFFSLYRKFLTIPDKVLKGTEPYDVTAINFDNLNLTSGTSADYTSQTIAHYITGLSIPKSVLSISEGAFATFGSLEYLETPFIGTERGSSAWYLNNVPVSSTDSSIRASKSFVSMFDKPSTYDEGLYLGYNADGTDKLLDSKAYRISQWYETTTLQNRTYRLPIDISKLVVTDEYSLGNHAIWYIKSLQYLEIYANEDYLENNSMNLGVSCFADNSNLVSIKLPISPNVNLTNAVGMLRGNTSLTEVRLPGSTYIPEACFAEDTSLEKVFLPSAVKDISTQAFYNCTALNNIYFYAVSTYQEGDSYTELNPGVIDFTTTLTSIGRSAFANCQKFVDVTVNSECSFIGYQAFSGCNSLVSMTLPFVGAHKGGSDISTYATSTGYQYHNCFGYIFSIESSSGTYRAIQSYGSGSSDVISFYIPNSLKTVTITNETQICYGALQNLTSIEYLYLKPTLSIIDSGALNGMSNLYHLETPFTNGHVGNIFGTSQYSDNSAYNASGYYIPSTLYEVNVTNQSTIQTSNFANAVSLRKVVIGDATSVINSAAFFNNPNLNSLSVPFVGRQRGYFTNTYNHYYKWWWWRDINIRDAFEWIFSPTSSDNTFANNSQYYYYNNWYTRYMPISLKEVIITNDTGISSLAFENQSYIESLSISAGNIDEGALKGMARLKTLKVPFIGYNSNPNSYNGRERVLGFIFGDHNSSYTYETSYGFNVPKTLSLVYITGSNPSIPDNAFNNCRGLITVNVSATIRSLGTSAFQNCVNLQTVTMPNAEYTTVGDYAFYNDSKLYDYSAIVPAETVTVVGNYSFYGTSVGGNSHAIDYSKFTKIGNYAFGNCTEIQSIVLSSNNTSIGTGAFSGCQSLTSVTLAGVVSPYMFQNCYLLEKINFNTEGNKVNAIPEGIFKNCYNLKFASNNADDGFVISTDTSSIGAYAFYGCTSFDRFIIPTKCISIGNYAFSKCTGLEYMTIPYETTTIGTNGWDDCDANFYFYVFKPESQWSSKWSTDWNCGYPVYIIGDIDENVFTYEYSNDHKGYFITGVEDGITLSGQITLPSRHNGLNVYGVIDKGEATTVNPLYEQIGITSVIIPKTMYYFASNTDDGISKGAFETGYRVDLYFEATEAEIAKFVLKQKELEAAGSAGTYYRGWKIGDTEYDDELGHASPFESGLITSGLIFYKDSWDYINVTSSSKAPAIKASCLYFDFSFSNQEYTGYQIKADSLNSVIYGTAIYVDDNSHDPIGKIYPDMFSTGDDYTAMFTSVYSNNINAGTATITSNLTTGLYEDYITKLKKYPLYITGTNKTNFTIDKAKIYLYSNDILNPYVINDVVYSGNLWSNSTWTGLVNGLDAFNATFSGTLSTRSKDAGTYSTSKGGIGSFMWTSSYAIYRNGVEVTKNFQVLINLQVIINPMHVTIAWSDDTPETDTDYLEYRYKGSTVIVPKAYAVKVDYDYSNGAGYTQASGLAVSGVTYYAKNPVYIVVSDVVVGLTNVDNYYVKSSTNVYTQASGLAASGVTYYKLTSNYTYDELSITAGSDVSSYYTYSEKNRSTFTTTEISDCIVHAEYDHNLGNVVLTPSETLYGAFAYLASASTHNYLLVFPEDHESAGEKVTVWYTCGKNTQNYAAVATQYKIINGLVTINIDLTGNNAYLIGTNEDYWQINFNADTIDSYAAAGYITGLGTNSVFLANYRTKDLDENDPKNYYINDDNEKIILGDKQQVYNVNNSDIVPVNTIVTYNDEITGSYANYHFYRIVNNMAYLEDNYYDLVINTFRVQIVYDEFELEYYIVQVDQDGNLIGATPLNITPTPVDEEYEENGVNKTRTVQNYTYAVDGYYYLMYVSVIDSNLITDFSQDYFFGDGVQSNNNGLYFREANQNFFFGANVAGRHYNQKQVPIRLKTIKSDVTFKNNLDKEYDREAYDILDFITKRDMVSTDPAQEITVDYFPKNIIDGGYANLGYTTLEAFLADTAVANEYKLSGGPVDVGEYAAIVNATETAYFNPLVNEIKYFDVIKRKIYINVDGTGCSFEEGTITGSRKYNAQTQTFTPTTASLSTLGYLLPDVYDNGTLIIGKDIFTGVLRTRSAEPGTYSSSVSGDFVWDTDFRVVSSLGVDNTSNYQVIVNGNFKIEKLDFVITEHNVDCVYDGSANYAYVDVQLDPFYDGGLTYTVYYSLTPIDTQLLSTYQVGIPPLFSTPTSGTVTVYYYVVGEYYYNENNNLVCKYYNPASGTLTVNVKQKTITYNDPAIFTGGLNQYIIPYDTAYHRYEVTVTDPWYATVYYSTDQQNWTTTPYGLSEINKGDPLIIYYKIEADYYETVTGGPIYFIITDEDFEDLDPKKYYVDDETVTYDGNNHSINITNDSTDPATLSYSLDGTTWTDTLPEYVNAGTYKIYVRFYVPLHKTITTYATLTIEKRSFIGLGIETKTGTDAITFDGEYHTLNVTGAYFSYEDVQVTDENDPNIVNTVRKYYYTDPTTKIKEEVTLSYSSNVFSIQAGYGFDSTKLEYKNANSTPYIIIIKISNENYNDCIVGDGTTTGLLQINVAEGSGTYTFKKIQYTKAEFDPESLKIETVHDGVRIFTYWAAYYDTNGNKCCDFGNGSVVADPRELGLYCFMVKYSGSKNVTNFQMGADNNSDPSALLFFEIVPKELTVEYLEEAYYSGEAFTPNPTVETGTSDELIINYTLIKTEINNVIDNAPDPDLEAIVVGDYTYSIEINGGNSNYVLNKYEITMRIIRRTIDITIVDEKVYDGKVYALSNSPYIDFENQDPDARIVYEYRDWGSFAGLLPEHKVVMTLQTSRSVITTYTGEHAVTSYYTNRVIEAYFDIFLMKARTDTNGDYVYDSDGKVIYDYATDSTGHYISVMDLYEVTGTFTIKITKQKFDIESCSETITYDGLPHTLKIFDTQNYVGDLAFLRGAIINAIYVDDEGNESIVSPTPHTNAGVWEYYVQVIKSGYETTYATLTLTIEYADLDITISDLYDIYPDYEIYNAEEKVTSYTVNNVDSSVITIFNSDSSTEDGSIRYYSTKDYSMADLVSFYNAFDETDSIFVNSLTTIKDAGDYYCVVYYKQSQYQWNASFAIKKLTIEKRAIGLTLHPSTSQYFTKEYDGEKLIVGLGGTFDYLGNVTPNYSFDTTDLVTGHYIDESQIGNFYIQTISANANTYYGPTGFEFKTMQILDSTGENVAYNYKPVVTSNLQVVITKAYLTTSSFIVSGITKFYDTEVGRPYIDTLSDGLLTYKYYTYSDYENNLLDLSSVQAGLPTNVGYYRVFVGIGEGTNHYASNAVNPITGTALGDQEVDVIIKQTEIDVEWSNTDTTFDGTTQTRVAKITEANDKVIYLHVYYFLDSTNTVDGYAAAGSYEAYAEFANDVVGNDSSFNLEQYNKNYKLKGEVAMFIIDPVVYDLNIGTVKVKLPIDTPWTGSFDTSMITGFPTDVLELSASTGATPEISTIYSSPGTYSSTDLFNISCKITNKLSGEVVTDSVKFNINGSVTIEANTVPCTYTDIEKVYRYGGYTFAEFNALSISSSVASKCSVVYSYYEAGVYKQVTNDQFVLTDVGSYTVDVKITCSGYQTTYLSISVEITPKDAFLTFTGTLTKYYDGARVSAEGLVSSTETEFGFNGVYSDLIYTYYCYPDGLGTQTTYQLSEAPVDAGDYMILVTCTETKINSNGLKNYTVLSKSLDFQIKAKELELSMQINETITVSDVGAAKELEYSYTPGQLTNLASYDYLCIAFSINKLARTTYYADVNLDNLTAPSTYTNSFTGTNVPTSYLATTFVSNTTSDSVSEADRTWSVRWLIYRTSSVDSSTGFYADVTGNYDISIDFDAYFHLELIKGYTVNGVGEAAGFDVQPYTGSNYHGSITTASGYTTGVTMQFATSTADFDTANAKSNIQDIYYSLPGKYKVYYKFTNGSNYEPLTGSYYIDIQKIASPIYIDDSYSKIYNATSIYTDYLGIGIVLPKLYYNNNNNIATAFDNTGSIAFLTSQNELINDIVSIKDIKVQYKNGSLILDGSSGSKPITAGTYVMTVTIPETKCCLETKLVKEFTISKRTILVSDKDSTNPANMIYNSNNGVYNDFSATNDYYNLYYVNDDNTKTLFADMSNVYSLTGTIVTKGVNVGTYRGSNTDSYVLKFSINPTVEVDGDSSVSNNYTVSLSEASYAIYNKDQEVYDVTPVYNYDGEYHTIKLQRSEPTTATIQCFDSDSNQWITLADYDSSNVSAAANKFYFADSNSTGDYVKWRTVAANYNDFEGETYVKIKEIQTTVTINTVLGKVYDGYEVLIPEDVTTNSTMQDSTDYTYTYYKWEQKSNGDYDWAMISSFEWKNGKYESIHIDLSVDRPIDVGKYMVEVTIPAATNYSVGVGTKEFEITSKPIDLIWSNDALTYNGLSQSATVQAPQTKGTYLSLTTTITPISATGDVDHKAVGSYLATADCSTISSNYTVTDSTKTKTFTISPKALLVQLNQSVVYTGTETVFTPYNETTNPSGFIVSGLCSDSTNGVSHSVYGNLVLSKTGVRTNSYKQFGTANDYYWSGNSVNGDTCVVLDENGNQVQSNYSIAYNLSVIINYSSISISVVGSDGYADVENSNWTYIYEPGAERYIKVNVLNADPDGYVVMYALSEDGGYTKNPIKFTNVAGTASDPGCYTVYYRVYKDGDSGEYELASSFVDNQAFYDIQTATVTESNFIANKYYRISTSTGRYELASSYIANSTYYTIKEVKDITSSNFTPNTYYISMDGYPPLTGSATITITPKNAALSFDNPLKDLSKTYDGVAILNTDHPVSCEDETASFNYRYYYYDESTENHKGNLVQTSGIPTNPINAGKYVLEVSVADHSNNYSSTPIRHEFEIYQRNVTVNVGPITKVFDYLVWSKQINNDNIKMNDNGNPVAGIANGHTFTGVLDTRSYLVGAYTDFSTNYRWRNNVYTIYDAAHNDVTENYNLSYDLSVKIVNAPICATVDCPVLTYDAAEHSITVELVQAKRKDALGNVTTYPIPQSYVIKYSTDGINYSTNNPKFRLTGKYPVFVRIEAENYETFEFSNGSLQIGPDGDEIIYKSYVQIDGVEFVGGYLDYAGKTEDSRYYYSGVKYPLPEYVNSPSTGAQTVKFYPETAYKAYRDAYSIQAPSTDAEIAALKAQYLDPYEIAHEDVIEAGKYHFVLTIDSDGIYDAQELNAPFEIYKREVAISWKDAEGNDTLTLEYTGEALIPSAYFIRVDGTQADLTVTITKDLSTNVECSEAITVGQYQVNAAMTEAFDLKNYKLLNADVTFTISKKKIPDLLLPDDLKVIYGDTLQLVDTSGNTILCDADGNVVYFVPSTHVVYIDEDGDTAIGIDNGDGTYSDTKKIILADGTLATGIEKYPYYITIDDNGDTGTHDINVSLTDPDNTMWEGQMDSDSLDYTFEVTPITIPDPTGRYKLNIALDKSTMVIDEDKPKAIVTVIDTQNNNSETTLIENTDYTLLYVDEENWEALVEASDEGKITASITITGTGNYSIAASKDFYIVDKAPDLLTIKEDATISFIKIKYDAVNKAVLYKEDPSLFDERSKDNYEGEDADGYKFYLSGIHQITSIKTIIDMFNNDSSYIKVFKTNDIKAKNDDGSLKYEIASDSYEGTLLGTGNCIVLYDDKGNIVDTIECIIFGDLDGDGDVGISDITSVSRYLSGDIALKTDTSTNSDDLSYTQLFAGVLSRDSETDIGISTYNSIKKYLADAENNDFNS